MIHRPERLEDLAETGAGVKITCKACKRERLVDRDRLIRDLTRRGLSTAWDALPQRLRCACGSKLVDIVAMPFTSGEENGEALFEALLRAFRRSADTDKLPLDGPGCRARSDSSRELHLTKTAMRAWIVARSAERRDHDASSTG